MTAEKLAINEALAYSKENVTQITKDFAIAWSVFGRRVTNNELLEEYYQGADTKEREFAQRFLDGIGFRVRHHPETPTPFRQNRAAIREIMIQKSVESAELAMANLDWNGSNIDHIVVSTSTSPDPDDRIGEWGQEVAYRIGANRSKVECSYLACDGAIGGWLYVLQRDELKGANVLIIAAEVLGNLANNFKNRAIFGNGTSVMAFNTNSMNLLSGATYVVPDPHNGVISSPHTYSLPRNDPSFSKDFQVDPEVKNMFSCNKNGLFVEMAETIEEFMTMLETPTAKHFAKTGSQYMLAVLKEYYELYGTERPIRLSLTHHASKGVHTLKVARLLSTLEKEGLPPVKVPWVEDSLGMANTSSAKTPAVIGDYHQQFRIPVGEVINITSYGAGRPTPFTSFNIRLKAA